MPKTLPRAGDASPPGFIWPPETKAPPSITVLMEEPAEVWDSGLVDAQGRPLKRPVKRPRPIGFGHRY